MKKNLLHHVARLGLPTLLLLLFCVKPAEAQAPSGFGLGYGLLVHELNSDLELPVGKGHQVLGRFFSLTPLRMTAGEPDETMSQREFLLTFERLRLLSQDETTILNDRLLYPMVWLKARRHNWLPDTRLTHRTVQEILYRYSVSERFGGIPYFEGLVLDEKDINAVNYKSVRKVRDIREDLAKRKADLDRLRKPTSKDTLLLGALDTNLLHFSALEEELRVLYHPLHLLPDLTDDFRYNIAEYDLNEVLGQLSYDYSTNTTNRIHNLVTGTMQMHGRIYAPDEIINLEVELGRGGWGKYKFGWVIFGGTEAWQFGGGLCGSATILFTPSWKAGLEIVRRYPHSAYYSDLYPTESYGLDATIYRGHKNLIMRNNTGSPLMYYVHDDKENKVITLYLVGNSPYRNITIDGPVKPSWNTFNWIRRMEGHDGTVVEDGLTTKYGRIY